MKTLITDISQLEGRNINEDAREDVDAYTKYYTKVFENTFYVSYRQC